jgi:DNA polymerase-3 subunit gamma/tau
MAKRKPTAPPADEVQAPAEYTVLARRYRPQQFRDVVGQEPVTRALVNALESHRVAHAYVFTGARGVGKTSTARILAKALNCDKGPTATPCDECDACRSIAGGDDLDVLEIDGASNRGIDEVRAIRQTIGTRPSRSRYKIYIIDEVHMLTKEAFNALLKTLEEPPPHVKFIFATTEVQKIPVTILSRCQRFDFAGINTPRIVEQLRHVVAGEGVQADDEALELIARRAGGSMRDAQSLLDQLLAFSGDAEGGRLTAEGVQRLLGMAHDDRVAALAAAVVDRDPKQALDLLAQAVDEGLQLGELLDQLIDYWRDLMVVQCAGAQARDLSVPSRHREALGRQAAALPLDTILAGLDVLNKTKEGLRRGHHGRVLVEMALVRLGRLTDLVSLAQLSQWLRGAESGERSPANAKRPTPMGDGTSTPRPSSSPARAAVPPEGEKKNLDGERTAGSIPTDQPAGMDVAAHASKGPVALSAESLPQVWREVLAQVGPMLAGSLEKAEAVAISGPKTLVLRFPPRYNHLQEHCQEPTRLARIEEALSRLTGQAWSVRIESGSNVVAPLPASAAEVEPSHSRYRRQRTEAMQVPLVQRAFELLGAQFVHAPDEGFGAAPGEPGDPAESTATEEP